MALEGPVITALVARLAEPTENLAAFGVTWSIALIIEAPVIMLLTAATVLAEDAAAARLLRRFMWLLGAVSTAGMVLMVIPPVFDFVALGLLALPPEVAERVRPAIACMLLWPGAIGYRRFHQGLMIRHGATGSVALGTVVRLISMGAACLALYTTRALDGAAAGGLALTTGVFFEALATRFMARRVLREHYGGAPQVTSESLTWSRLLSFYLPLTITVLIAFSIQPLNTFFVSRGPQALESLAVLPVTGALSFLVFSVSFSLQETVIVLGGRSREHLAALRRFAVILGGGQLAVMSIISGTVMAELWFAHVAGLPAALLSFGIASFALHLLQPSAQTMVVWQRAQLVKARRTRVVTAGAVLEIGLLAGGLAILIPGLKVPGAWAVPVTTTVVAVLTAFFLHLVRRKVVPV